MNTVYISGKIKVRNNLYLAKKVLNVKLRSVMNMAPVLAAVEPSTYVCDTWMPPLTFNTLKYYKYLILDVLKNSQTLCVMMYSLSFDVLKNGLVLDV